MVATYKPGGIVQNQRWFYPGTEIDRLPMSTSFSTRLNATGSFIEKSSVIKTIKGADGWREPTPYSLERWDYSEFQGDLKLVPSNTVNDVYEYDGSYTPASRFPKTDRVLPSVDANMVRRAETECLGKLKDLNVNYAVALAESRKTVGLVGKTIWQLYDAYRHAKKLRWKQAARSLGVSPPGFKKSSKDVSGRWLELQYGWLPLMGDLYGLYEDNRKGFLRSAPRVSVQRTILKPVSDFKKSFDSLDINYSHSDGSKYGVKVRLDYQLDSSALSSAASAGLLNPFVVAWELVPFSFVIDWALPIGNWLEAFDASYGLTFIGGSKTTFVRINRKGVCKHKRAREPYRIHAADLTSQFDYFKMNRSIYGSPPIPTPYWKSPISTAHALNALALLRALLK